MAVLWSTAAQHGTGVGGKRTKGGSASRNSTVSMAYMQQLTKPACGRGGTQGKGEGGEGGRRLEIRGREHPAGGSEHCGASARQPPAYPQAPSSSRRHTSLLEQQPVQTLPPASCQALRGAPLPWQTAEQRQPPATDCGCGWLASPLQHRAHARHGHNPRPVGRREGV